MPPNAQPAAQPRFEPPAKESNLQSLASLCCTVITLFFALTFVFENVVIPSSSMASTLLVGDHVLVDRTSLAPSGPHLLPYRPLHRGEPVVFFKPVLEPDGTNIRLVKRVVGIPGDRIHLEDGILYLNGIAQSEPYTAQPTTLDDNLGRDAVPNPYRDNFPAVPPDGIRNVTATWTLDLPSHIESGDLVVPPDHYFMMGDNRTNSLDSRYWGLVDRSNLIGRPLFVYWSIATPEQDTPPTTGQFLAQTLHEATHFFTDTRWRRTLHPVH